MIGHVGSISLYFLIYGGFFHYDISPQTLRISLMPFPLMFQSEYVPAWWWRRCIVPSTRIVRFIHLKPLTNSNVIIGSRDWIMCNMIAYSKIGRLLLPPLHHQWSVYSDVSWSHCDVNTITLVMSPMSSFLVLNNEKILFYIH